MLIASPFRVAVIVFAIDAWILRYGEDSVFDLTARPHYGTPHMKLFWNAPYPGDYFIYSTTDPDLMTVPPGPGWTLEVAIPISMTGMQSWDHDNAMGGGDMEQRRYQIIVEP
ncbi:MAG: hypothetical protein K8R58_11610 [Bacteroidales bacterium]|nr:hypothetical protein [Bacteroidales bacterium]